MKLLRRKKPGLSLKASFQNARSVAGEFSGQFWILVAAFFIDRVGGAMLFPFFTLYLTAKFGIGMVQVGVLFGLFSIAGVVGSMVGGALTDRLGRKGMLIFGLVMSALSSVLMGVINDYVLFFAVSLVVGIMAEMGGPAAQALVADLLPEEKRAQGFGILRVGANLAVAIGPLIGGLLASYSYLLLFIVDALTSTITAAIVFFTLKETWKPQPAPEGEQAASFLQSFAGYGKALRDRPFVLYLAASALMALVYLQMNTSLAVFLRDNHGVDARGFSYILSLNAAMVVLFQFSTTRWVSRYRPLVVMAVGTVFYALGFAMYGFVSAFAMFLVAMVIITIGEMMVSPVGQSIVARLAPEDMRGRYMAVFGFSWVIPAAIGPLMAGFVLDYLNPNWLWYAAGLIGLVAALAFYSLERLVDRAHWTVIDRRLEILELFEQGRISAETAASKLAATRENPLDRLAPQAPASSQRHLRIRVSDLNSGVMKVDLRLPMGLVNTLLYAGGQVTTDLDAQDNQLLREMMKHSTTQTETEDKRLEIQPEE